MTQAPVQFMVRCVCGTTLKVCWEASAHAFEWNEVKKQQCLVVEPCETCKSKKRNTGTAPDDWYRY